MENGSEALIRLEQVSKVFITDEVETHALAGIHFELKKGEYLSIAGPSGARVNTGPCTVDPATVTATGPVVNTAASFTVSAWVNLTTLTGYQTFVSIAGTSVATKCSLNAKVNLPSSTWRAPPRERDVDGRS